MNNRDTEDWGILTECAALDRLVTVTGRSLLDIGCGDGWLSRALAERGATVLGIEPEPAQAARNAQAAVINGVRLQQASAEQLPVADGSVDGVFFHYSLHHVPVDAMVAALREAHRALRRGGFLYVAEPLAAGSFQRTIELFHDETEVRRQAQRALDAEASSRFARHRRIRYTTRDEFADFAAFVDAMTPLSYNGYSRADIDTDAVRARFDRYRDGAVTVLQQPVQLDLYQESMV